MGLLQKIIDRSACVTVIGGGYVGLPLAVASAQAGFTTTIYDLDERRMRALNVGEPYIEDVPSDRLKALVYGGRLRGTSFLREVPPADIIVICVPTPLNKTKDPDNSFIVKAADDILPSGDSKNTLVILESTTFPGFTREVLAPKLAPRMVAFSPERIDPGNQTWTLINTPKVVGGVTPEAALLATRFYETFVRAAIVQVSSADAAEMAKLLENTQRSVNIGLANETAIMCRRLGLDTREVIAAAASKPYGFTPYYPGPGVGGHCIPVDPLYLAHRMKTLQYDARFISIADEVNSEMPGFVVELVTDALNSVRKPVNGSGIIVVGITYKRDVADIRESPAVDIIDRLVAKDAFVTYYDPLAADLPKHPRISRARTVNGRDLADCDCVVIATDHSSIDWDVIMRAPLIVDTRGVTRDRTGSGKVIRL